MVEDGVPELTGYDWVLINSSAGKDSMAMLVHLVELCDHAGVERGRIVVVHADMGRMEWAGTRELAEEHARSLGLRFEVVRREEDLLDHVRTRNATLRARPGDDGKAPAWPSAAARWCTSDHKTSQVVKLITRLVRESDPAKLGRRVRVLNCLGMRAQESVARAKKVWFGPDPANWSTPPRRETRDRPARLGVSHSRREVDRCLVIFTWTEEEVWARVKASGLRWHWAYDVGMSRLSCVFCILAPREQLVLAARHNPELALDYVAAEREVGHTFKPGLSMNEVAVAAGLLPAIPKRRAEQLALFT